MSKRPGPNRPTTIRSTQQQLADLDALLERMLALPVHRLDEDELARIQPDNAATAATAEPAAEPSPPAALQTLTFVPIPAEPEEEPATAGGAAFVEIPPAHEEQRQSLSQAVEEWQFPAPAAAAFPLVDAEPPAEPAEPISTEPWTPMPSTPTVDGPTPPRTPTALLPLVWGNRAFDAALSHLGGPGRWLQGRAGKTLLGLTGLLLLVGAMAWGILDWLGWSW